MALKIILLGYMGSGKSTVGQCLASDLSFDFLDLDLEIEKEEKIKVSEIFQTKGAIYFRKKEKEVLEKLMSLDKNMVLSLGGGTPCYFDSMNYLNNLEEVKTVYLDIPIPILSDRLMREKDQRPLLKNVNSEEEMLEFIGKHLFERRPFYNQAGLKIKVGEETAKQVAQQIAASLF
ncbi:shikimate kinase [Nonlabens sp.]|uniref:shikimate kinase n=1 Tax=Nonlabens TaxID=363408 RepID=UPI0032648AF0